MATVMTGSDIQPRELAELLDGMVQVLAHQDREMARILTTARDALAALAWNRYAAHHTRLDARRTFRQHHKTLMGIRAR